MEIMQVTAENIHNEHIGCALGNTPAAKQSEAQKKDWMRNAFADGYQFHRLKARGKVLVETTPAENAWCPIEGAGWLFIDCLWVSGQFKGQGIASLLLGTALERAKAEDKKGLLAVSATTKKPFLSDPGFYRHKGFVAVDTAPPYYELLALPLLPNAMDTPPRFAPQVKSPCAPQKGVVIYYSHHCPHTEQYSALLEACASEANAPFSRICFKDKQQAQNAPNPFTTWAMFYNGTFITNEIFSEAKFIKFLENQ